MLTKPVHGSWFTVNDQRPILVYDLYRLIFFRLRLFQPAMPNVRVRILIPILDTRAARNVVWCILRFGVHVVILRWYHAGFY